MKNYVGIIKKRMDDVRNFLDVELNPDDPSLEEQITLKNSWDNPKELSKAMDMQPAYFARWATVLKHLKTDRAKLDAEYGVWASDRRQKIRALIISKRKKKGLTDKQSEQNITQIMVDDEFNKRYSYTGSQSRIFLKYKNPLDEIDRYIDRVSVVVEAFKMRKDLLVVQGYLLKSMLENKIMITGKKRIK